MASPANPQHEPTMEEILASIRKIISEDSSDAAAPAAETVQEESEILELTQEVPPESAQGVRAAEPDDVVFKEVEEPKMAESSNSESTGSEIFSDKTRAALDDAFAGLNEAAAPPAAQRATLPPIEGHSIEAVFQRAVRDSFEPLLRNHLEAHSDALMAQMKPLIREWMDENFPALLEDAVRSEVARVVKARSRR